MISGFERLVRLVDEYEQLIEDADDQAVADARFEERDVFERQLLLTPVQSVDDVVAKLKFLARSMGDGERVDGADIAGLRDLAAWMEARFGEARDPQAGETEDEARLRPGQMERRSAL